MALEAGRTIRERLMGGEPTLSDVARVAIEGDVDATQKVLDMVKAGQRKRSDVEMIIGGIAVVDQKLGEWGVGEEKRTRGWGAFIAGIFGGEKAEESPKTVRAISLHGIKEKDLKETLDLNPEQTKSLLEELVTRGMIEEDDYAKGVKRGEQLQISTNAEKLLVDLAGLKRRHNMKRIDPHYLVSMLVPVESKKEGVGIADGFDPDTGAVDCNKGFKMK